MKNMLSSNKFYWILIFTLVVWIALSFVPMTSCHHEYFFGVFHWNVCDNMSFLQNLLYVVFEVLAMFGSAYLIIITVMKLKK